MKKCKYEPWIDRYLLDKLEPGDQAKFEEHYFICPHCFAKLDQQSEIVQILKKEGVLGGPDQPGEHVHHHRRPSLLRRLFRKPRRG